MPDRISHLRQAYKMTKEHYDWLLEMQNGKCALCLSTSPRHKSNKFCIDHCHKTNVVRGLLCGSCNTAIGQLKDDVTILSRAIGYIVNEGLSKELLSKNFSPPTRKKSGTPVGTYKKLSPAVRIKILEMRLEGKSQEAISKVIKVSQPAVSKYLLSLGYGGKKI